MSEAITPNKVEQWGMYEVALDGPRGGNPFLDVELRVRFGHGERAVRVDGFYDGDGVYRARCMPDAVGTWSWMATTAGARPFRPSGTSRNASVLRSAVTE